LEDATLGSRLRRALRRRFSREEAEGLTLTVGFAACALIVFLFGLLAREVFAVSGPDPLDWEITLWARALYLPGGRDAARAVTLFGSWIFLAPATIATVTTLAVRKRRVSAILFAGSVVGGFGLETILKLLFHRSRPGWILPVMHELTYSFPSGHATMATVFFGGIAALVFHLTPRPGPRAASLVGAALAVSSIGFSRIYLGVHWLTDVAGGILVGLFWVVVSATATEIVAARRRR
jgi:undecaprenyl-diphosphatase